MTKIKCPLRETANISGEATAIISGEVKLLYNQLDLIVTSTTRRLRERHCKPGDRIAIFMNNDWQTIVLTLSLLRIGAIACHMSTRLPAQTLRNQLDAIDYKKLIAYVEGKGLKLLAGVERWSPDDLIIKTLTQKKSIEDDMISLSQPTTIVFTSGSSSAPKPVLLTYGNHYYSAQGSNLILRLRSKHRWLISLPLYHVGGLAILFRCLITGATMVIPERKRAIDTSLKEEGITHCSLVPAQLYRLSKSKFKQADFQNLQVILLGGSSVSSTLLKEAYKKKLPVYITYGLTEMASQVTSMRPDSPPVKRITSGQLLKHRELKIEKDGEIWVRGKTLFAGYVDGQDAHCPVNHEGWFATGDRGYLDEEGYLIVLGRKDNMFISGGENIQPEEIERAICMLEDVDQAIVVPVSDEEFGSRPVAFIQGKNGDIDIQKIVYCLEQVLPRFKIPVVFYPWPEEMEPDRMKVDRKRLSGYIS
ncbi:MAG: o-succinylbenzoate--CoA ligase [Kiritimatiellae bacterium]|nr:o-succinylbenzoate--CoA ligase [Kiritimatiellia bacterium]